MFIKSCLWLTHIKVDKDGSYTIVDGIYPSGRCFLGMTSVMTDEKVNDTQNVDRIAELQRSKCNNMFNAAVPRTYKNNNCFGQSRIKKNTDM